MNSSAPTIESIIDALAALPAPVPGSLSDAEATAWIAKVEQAGRHIDALRVSAAGDIDERSDRDLGRGSLSRRFNVQSASQLVELLTRVSAGEASRRIRLARDIAPRVSILGAELPPRYEHVAAAVRAGDLGVDAGLAIVRNLTMAARRAPIEQLEAAERALVDDARILSADLVAVQARVWRGALDPDGAAPRERELRRQRRFVIGRERNGMTPFFGEADPISAAQLRAWLGERTAPDRQPRFLDADDPAFDDGAAPSPTGDPRSREQRSFDVVMGLLQAGVRADALSATPKHSAANVMVVVKQSDLDRSTGTAWLSDVHEPISAAAAGTLACDAGIQRVLVSDSGQPLALGRRERFFTAAQRKALAVRDGGCAFPECTSPPSWTHAHHVIPWSHDGPTDVDNGVLLCSFHHHLVHDDDGYEIRMVDGIPHLRMPLPLGGAQTWHRMGRHRVPVAA